MRWSRWRLPLGRSLTVSVAPLVLAISRCLRLFGRCVGFAVTGDESPIVPGSGFTWRVTVEQVGAEPLLRRSMVATGWDARSAVVQAAATPLAFWRDPEATAYEGDEEGGSE